MWVKKGRLVTALCFSPALADFHKELTTKRLKGYIGDEWFPTSSTCITEAGGVFASARSAWHARFPEWPLRTTIPCTTSIPHQRLFAIMPGFRWRS